MTLIEALKTLVEIQKLQAAEQLPYGDFYFNQAIALYNETASDRKE